jgi:hypothetical protein
MYGLELILISTAAVRQAIAGPSLSTSIVGITSSGVC